MIACGSAPSQSTRSSSGAGRSVGAPGTSEASARDGRGTMGTCRQGRYLRSHLPERAASLSRIALPPRERYALSRSADGAITKLPDDPDFNGRRTSGAMLEAYHAHTPLSPRRRSSCGGTAAVSVVPWPRPSRHGCIAAWKPCCSSRKGTPSVSMPTTSSCSKGGGATPAPHPHDASLCLFSLQKRRRRTSVRSSWKCAAASLRMVASVPTRRLSWSGMVR